MFVAQSASLLSPSNTAESTISARSATSGTMSGILLDGVAESASVVTAANISEQHNTALAKMYVDSAQWFSLIDQEDDAELCAKHATALAPAASFISVYSAETALASGDVDAALTHCEQAVMLNPLDVEAYVLMASALHNKGDHDLAEARIAQALNIDPNSANSHRVLGQLLKEKAALPAAARALVRALQLEKSTPILPYTTLLPSFAPTYA